jgi:hypothetical protein
MELHGSLLISTDKPNGILQQYIKRFIPEPTVVILFVDN